MRTPYPNELYHHGVAGQKWGVRNGPPYPLYEGHGNSKAVKASKAKYGPEKNGFADKQKEKGHHTKFERQMARKENKQLKKLNKYAEKAEKAKSEHRKEHMERKAQKAKAIADNIAEKGQKYYSLDKKEQKKISRGYARVKAYSTLKFLVNNLDNNPDTDYSALDKAILDKGAEANALRRIDVEYRKKNDK